MTTRTRVRTTAMPLVRAALQSMFALALLTASTVWGATPTPEPVSIARGAVDSVSGTSPPALVIDGLIYQFALDAKVELGGTKFGAPSMVERNMKVEYTYTTQRDERRTIVLLRQLSPDVRVLEH